MSDIRYCQGSIYEHGQLWSCGFKAKVERDGKPYCGVHDPVRLKAKQEARDAKAAKNCEKERISREEALTVKASYLLRDLIMEATENNINTVKRYLK